MLHVMASLERSGMEQMLLSSGAAWRRAGYACDVVATANSEGPVAQQIRDCGYGVFHLPFRSRLRWLPRARFLRDFYALCASGYDVVHIQVEAGRPLFALLARLAGVRRLAVTPHNTFRFEGALRVRKMLERHFIRMLGGRFGMISEGVEACERERFGIRGKRIWNWIDTEHFRPPSTEERARARCELGLADEEFAVVSVANCNRAKNHTALLQAIALLQQSDRPIYLHVGREEAGRPEHALSEKLGLGSRVHFLGSQADTRKYFWAADAVAMPSLNEGLAISALEATACGAPLVCSKVDGLLEIAAQTKAAVLTSTDAESIADGMLKMRALGSELRRQQALRDSIRIREQFSLDRGVNSIVDALYA
ncbi:MAG: glycosyltransferase [Acidocella sp.]|nr:glycosyltransferase [Acidocella sp.]